MKYLVLTLRTPNFLPSVVEQHSAFLNGLRASGHLESSGPFIDRSGGAYVLDVGSLEEASAIAFRDPLHTTGSSQVRVFEWDCRP